jgi:hypothetical protein
MGGALSRHGINFNAYKFLVQERDDLQALEVDGRMILKSILKRQTRNVRTGFVWFGRPVA